MLLLVRSVRFTECVRHLLHHRISPRWGTRSVKACVDFETSPIRCLFVYVSGKNADLGGSGSVNLRETSRYIWGVGIVNVVLTASSGRPRFGPLFPLSLHLAASMLTEREHLTGAGVSTGAHCRACRRRGGWRHEDAAVANRVLPSSSLRSSLLSSFSSHVCSSNCVWNSGAL